MIKNNAIAFDNCLANSVMTANGLNYGTSPISISTISSVALLNADNISLATILRKISKFDSIIECNGMKFSNSVILKFKQSSKLSKNITIKLFSNGKLHITGPVTAIDSLDAVDKICTILDDIFEKKKNTFKLCDFRVQMVNSNFNIERKPFFTKAEIHKLLRDHDLEAWIPEEHPAVRLKLKIEERNNLRDKVTVLIFESGAIIITGLKSGDELLFSFKKILDIINGEAAMIDGVLDRAIDGTLNEATNQFVDPDIDDILSYILNDDMPILLSQPSF